MYIVPTYNCNLKSTQNKLAKALLFRDQSLGDYSSCNPLPLPLLVRGGGGGGGRGGKGLARLEVFDYMHTCPTVTV